MFGTASPQTLAG